MGRANELLGRNRRKFGGGEYSSGAEKGMLCLIFVLYLRKDLQCLKKRTTMKIWEVSDEMEC